MIPAVATNRPEAGGMFFYILLGVALFAALSYAVATSMRGGGGDISAERAKLIASDFIDMGGKMNEAVSRLKLNGCKENQISFENSVVSGYTNSNAPADKSCHVFDASGAGMSWVTTPETSFTNEIYYIGTVQVQDVGTNGAWAGAVGADLVSVVEVSSREICMAINDALSIANFRDDWAYGTDPPYNNNHGNIVKFQGTYVINTTFGGLSGQFAGKSMGCFKESGSANPSVTGPYYFYTVLLAR